MNPTPEQTRSASTRTNSLWAAIGALGVVVIALGSALYFVQTRRVEPRAIIALDLATPAAEVAVAPAAPASAVNNSQISKEKKAAPKEKQATAATKSVAIPAKPPVPVAAAPAAAPPSEAAPAAGGSAVYSGYPPVSQTRVCANCGTVTAVTPVEREGTPSGAGVVAGGVLGALVGNQFGGGDGKTVATILGAIGGGMAGNTVEKKMKKETVYQVQLRMEDGSTRTVEQTTPATVGAKVTVEGGALRSADGSLSTPVPSAPAARSGGG